MIDRKGGRDGAERQARVKSGTRLAPEELGSGNAISGWYHLETRE